MEVVSKVETKLVHIGRDIVHEANIKGIDGELHKCIRDWSKVDMQHDKKGNPLPAIVAFSLSAVKYYRLQGMPIKALLLKKTFFQGVVDWCRFQMLDSKAEMDFTNITLDSVFVRELSHLSLKDFDVEYY